MKAETDKRQKAKSWCQFHKACPEVNIYLTLLKILTRDASYKKSGLDSFVHICIKSFMSWLEGDGVRDSLASFLTPEVQELAFHYFCFVTSVNIFKLIVSLNENHDLITPLVSDILKRVDFRRGCELIMELQLHDKFSLDETVIPLTVSNRNSPLSEKFLEGSKRLQEEMLGWLDTLTELGPYVLQDNLTATYPGITDLDLSRLSGAPLDKFIKKLVANFSLKAELAPRHLMTKLVGALRYHVGQKESFKMRPEHWRELVYKQVKDNLQLQCHLIKYLIEDRVTSCDIDEAIYWFKRLKIPRSKLPNYVEQELQRIESGANLCDNNDQVDEDWDTGDQSSVNVPTTAEDLNVPSNANDGQDDCWPTTSNEAWGTATNRPVEYLQLDVDADRIIFVDDAKKLDSAVQELRNELATKSKIYLIDCHTFLPTLNDNEVVSFVDAIFVKGINIILGYSLHSDLKVLANTHSAFDKLVDRTLNFLDLEWFSKLLTSGFEKAFSLPFSTDLKGLAGLTEMVLGKPLDKRDQISDWGRRPLTNEQLSYAALDAKVLVLIYDELLNLAEKNNQCEKASRIEADLKKFRNKPPKGPKKKKYYPQSGTAGPSVSIVQASRPSSEAIKPGDLKLVCDSMLQGLAKRLTYYGVDAVAIEPFEDAEACGKRGHFNGRCIITKGMNRYANLAQFVNRGDCLALKSDQLDDQVEEVWKHFNVNFQ